MNKLNKLWMILGAIAVALGIAPAAEAAKPADIGLSFDLAPSPITSSSTETIAAAPAPAAQPPTEAKLLALPQQGADVPIGSAQSLKKEGVVPELPPPPEVAPALVEPVPPEPVPPAPATPELVTEADAPAPAAASDPPIQFDAAAPAPPPVAIDPPESAPVPPAPPAPLPVAIDPAADGAPVIAAAAPASDSQSLAALFKGEENSLVARAVGSAEGTRTPDGGKTWAYRGHTDPGNGVWNMGTFSYQHGANTPEEADRKQLKRLMGQAETLRQHAADRGITLTLEEELNGIDLANQSPRAALSRGGYMDRLKQAHEMGLQGAEAVLWARTRAFLDPDTSRWNAPGLGNNVHSITADQERRRKAIARVIEATATPLAEPPIAVAPPEPRREEMAAAPPDQQEAIANQIISLDLPPS